MKSLLCASVALLALSAVPCLLGQTLGEITGRVSDATGASVPNATVTITNVATNAIRTAASTDAGYYTFPSVAPGFYDVKTEQAGFKTANSKNVEVQVQQTVRLDFTLQVGQVAESIDVSASAELLQAENASLGTVVENQAVMDLPLNGREYLGLVALSANANTLSAPSVGPGRAWEATAALYPFRPPATASSSTTSRWTASPTPTPTSGHTWCCPPSMRFRNSRCRLAFIRPSSDMGRLKSTC